MGSKLIKFDQDWMRLRSFIVDYILTGTQSPAVLACPTFNDEQMRAEIESWFHTLISVRRLRQLYYLCIVKSCMLCVFYSIMLLFHLLTYRFPPYFGIILSIALITYFSVVIITQWQRKWSVTQRQAKSLAVISAILLCVDSVYFAVSIGDQTACLAVMMSSYILISVLCIFHHPIVIIMILATGLSVCSLNSSSQGPNDGSATLLQRSIGTALHMTCSICSFVSSYLERCMCKGTLYSMLLDMRRAQTTSAENRVVMKLINSVMPSSISALVLEDVDSFRASMQANIAMVSSKGSVQVDDSCSTMEAEDDTPEHNEYPSKLDSTVGEPKTKNIDHSMVSPSVFRPFVVRRMSNVSILFADIVGFTQMSSNKSASQLVALLDDLYKRFDKLCLQNGCEKIATLGDCYYCVSGCPSAREGHALCCVRMGLAMIQTIGQFDKDHDEDVQMRVGVHTGSVNCGIIGIHKFKFDIFSNDVTLANEMESSGRPGFVHLTQSTFDYLKDVNFSIDEADPHVFLGKAHRTYLVSDSINCKDTTLSTYIPDNHDFQSTCQVDIFQLHRSVSKELLTNSSFAGTQLDNNSNRESIIKFVETPLNYINLKFRDAQLEIRYKMSPLFPQQQSDCINSHWRLADQPLVLLVLLCVNFIFSLAIFVCILIYVNQIDAHRDWIGRLCTCITCVSFIVAAIALFPLATLVMPNDNWCRKTLVERYWRRCAPYIMPVAGCSTWSLLILLVTIFRWPIHSYHPIMNLIGLSLVVQNTVFVTSYLVGAVLSFQICVTILAMCGSLFSWSVTSSQGA